MKKTQLFLLHFAGGNCYSFQFIIPFLKDFSVIPIELPGRGNRTDEILLKDLNTAAQDIYYQILSKLDGSGFMIYGHSLGALLGLKVTGMLELTNKYPRYLFVSGHRGPIANYDKKRYLYGNEEIVEELLKFGGVPPEVLESSDFLNYYLPILKADYEVAEKDAYFELVVNAPIFAMMGDEEEGVEKISNWQNFTRTKLKSHIFNGAHFFIHKYSEEIANLIVKNYNEHDLFQ